MLAKYKFTALYEGFTVHTIQIQATSSATSTSKTATTTDDYLSLYLKYKDRDGVVVSSEALSFVDVNATFTNQTLYVPSGGSTVLSVYGNMNAVETGYANSGDGPQLGLVWYIATSGSQPTWSTSTVTNAWSKQMVLYKSKPTVGPRAGIISGTLVAGTNDLYAVTIAADSKGDVAIKKLVFYITGGMSTSTDKIGTFKFYKGTIDYSDKVKATTTLTDGTGVALSAISDKDGNTTTNLAIIFDDEETITADTSQTYYLKANVSGVDTTGEYIQTYVKGDTTYATGTAAGYWSGPTKYANASSSVFVWSDITYPRGPYTESTSEDWTNGYLVKTVPSTLYTLKY